MKEIETKEDKFWFPACDLIAIFFFSVFVTVGYSFLFIDEGLVPILFRGVGFYIGFNIPVIIALSLLVSRLFQQGWFLSGFAKKYSIYLHYGEAFPRPV